MSTPLTFEAAQAELEELVTRMESGKLTLEESVSAYQRGAELAKHCQALLTQAQQQVDILMNGELQPLVNPHDDKTNI